MLTVPEMHEHMRRLFDGLLRKGHLQLPSDVTFSGDTPERRQREFLFRRDWWTRQDEDGEAWLKLSETPATENISSHWSMQVASREYALFLETMETLRRRHGHKEEDIAL